MALTDKLSAIGDAIRAKTGGTDMLTLDQMPTAIAGIQTGSGSGGDYNIIVTNNSDGTQSFAITDASGSSGGSGFWDEDYVKKFIQRDNTVTSVVLPDGITKIGSGVFYNCMYLDIDTLPDTILEIGSSAFSYCFNLSLTSLPSGLTKIDTNAFSNCKKLALTSLPSGLTEISLGTFNYCENLDLTYLPSGLTEIGSSAFSYCKKISITSIPEGVISIGTNAFLGCVGLTSITFNGTPTSISITAFKNCTNITDIYVPWAEGAVANAPWGATNATIHYNTTT